MKATLQDIAQEVGVSKALVSMYLNNHKLSARIADGTKKKIDHAIKKLNYQPSFTARALSSGKTRTIGMICGGIRNPYFAYLVEDAMEEAARLGYQLLLSLTRWIPEEEERALENLLNRQIDALICCNDLTPGTRAHDLLKSVKIPLYCINYAGGDFPAADMNILPAMRETMRRFAAKGYRSVYGSFYRKSLWHAAFLSASEEFGLTPQIIAEESDANQVADLVAGLAAAKRHAYVVNGYRMHSRLVHAFRAHPEYRPEMVVGIDEYTIWQTRDYISGGIFSDTPTLICQTVKRLIDAAENSEVETGTLLLDTVFLTPEEIDLRQERMAETEAAIPFPGQYDRLPERINRKGYAQ